MKPSHGLVRNNLPRRAVLKTLAGGIAAACPICASLASGSPHEAQVAGKPAPAHKPHWSYEGEGGPKNWGGLQADFRVCDLGMEQSPIDLQGSIRAQTGAVSPAFQETPLAILNNGHTIQVNCAPGNYSTINGKRYDLVQFHFHHPSEHLLSGKRFDLELHFVHRSAEGNLAVLGVFIQPGAMNTALAPIWAALPREAGPVQQVGTTIRPGALLPASRSYFRYQGSLTTPPCSEGVLWTVFGSPIEASADQIKQFAQLFANNARPPQGLHRRFLLESL
jgi:carbonic anhydrase